MTDGHRSANAKGGARLPSIDGLRGIAASWVLLFHLRYVHEGPSIPFLDGLSSFGYYGVSLFLVLSGFCLYLPFANGRQDRFKFFGFWTRRCRRIMPAFYVVLGLTLAMKTLSQTLAPQSQADQVPLLISLLAHVTFLFTLFPQTYFSMHGTFWSLGLEWQLYILLPVLIVSIARMGVRKTLAIALACSLIYSVGMQLLIRSDSFIAADSVLAFAVIPNFVLGRWPEFLLGMLVAEGHARGYLANKVVTRVALFGVVLIPVSLSFALWPVTQVLAGAGFASLVTLAITRGHVFNRLLSLSPIVWLGTISYSLYLVHGPLLAGADTVLRHVPLGPVGVDLASAACVPFIVAFAALMYRYVERPFLAGSEGPPVAAAIQWSRSLAQRVFRSRSAVTA